MPLPFDATLKDLGRKRPAGFLAVFDCPPRQTVSVLNVDLSTVTTSADLILGLGEPLREIKHLDFQSGANATKHRDSLVYNALLYRQYGVPIHTILVFLRPQAAHSDQTGTVAYQSGSGSGSMHFNYDIVSLWKRSVEDLLKADLIAVPLAPLGQLPEGVELEVGLGDVVRRVVERLLREAGEEARELITASFILTGLRVPRSKASELFRGVKAMHDSDTYLAILDEGAVREAKATLLRLGQKKFGPPDEATRATLNSLEDLDELHRLSDLLLDVHNWQELLAAQTSLKK